MKNKIVILIPILIICLIIGIAWDKSFMEEKYGGPVWEIQEVTRIEMIKHLAYMDALDENNIDYEASNTIVKVSKVLEVSDTYYAKAVFYIDATLENGKVSEVYNVIESVLEPTNLLENKGKEFNAFSGEVWTNIEDSKNVYYIINGDLYSEDNLIKSLYVFEEGRIELD